MSIVTDYRRDGYCVLRNVFQFPMIAEQMKHKHAEWKAMPKDEYLRAARLFAQGVSQTVIFAAPPIWEAVQALGVKDPVFLTTPAVHVMGVDETWEGVSAHQDWPALQSGLNGVVVWIPYTNVGLDNYPVEFVPGSHLRGLLPAKAGAHYSEVDTDGMEFVPVPVNVGDVLLFSVFTVHRTRTPGHGFRLAFSHRYEDSADPWFKEHGNYSAQCRAIDREVKWTPTVDQVRSVFA